jgi:hypothetical protein
VSTPLGIPVPRRSEPNCSSADLVQDFVYYTADRSVAEAAEIAGVSTATLSRWRRMGARQLRADVRRRLVAFVAQRERDPILDAA